MWVRFYIEKFTPKWEQYNKSHTNVFNEYSFKNISDAFSFIILKNHENLYILNFN